MIQYNFIPQLGKGNPKIRGVGLLTWNDKEVIFFEGHGDRESKILGELKNPEIKFINSRGIMLKGFEPSGFTKDGRQKFNYQEWYLSFVLPDASNKLKVE